MSLGPISRAARQLERNAPKNCLIGLRIIVVAFLIAVGGFAVAATINTNVGYVIAVGGFLGALFGMALYVKGFLFDRKRDAP